MGTTESLDSGWFDMAKVTTDQTAWEWYRDGQFLRNFIDAPDGRLPNRLLGALALQAGFKTAGAFGGFYTYNGSLRRDKEWSYLTPVGRRVYEEALVKGRPAAKPR